MILIDHTYIKFEAELRRREAATARLAQAARRAERHAMRRGTPLPMRRPKRRKVRRFLPRVGVIR